MKKNLFPLLIAFIVLMPQSMAAFDFQQGGIYYNILSSTEVEVTYGNELNGNPSDENLGSYGGDIIIPETVDYGGTDYNVTAIGDYAFSGCMYLLSVTIPSSVTRIGDYAFAYNSALCLISYMDPREITMGDCVFDGVDPEYCTLYVPDHLWGYYEQDICWSQSFYNILCTYLFVDDIGYDILSSWQVRVRHVDRDIEEISIPETIFFGDKMYCVSAIGDDAFSNCSNLKNVSIPMSVGSIGKCAFSYCTALTEITIPDGVYSIDDEAFMGCTGLTSMTIPDGVSQLGNGVFRYCEGLTSVTLSDCITAIGSNTFEGCTNLTNVTIPYYVTSIGWDAFAGCKRLKGIIIPNYVRSIEPRAFLRCDSLAYVTFGRSVESIGQYAFDGCGYLTSLTIPRSVTSIGYRAFSSTARLESMTVERFNPVYDSRDNCNAIIETSSNTLISGCKNTVIPNTVTAIGDAAFFNALYQNVKIPGSVTSIGKNAFAGCWIRSVTCFATIPPEADYDLFYNGSTSALAPLYVPFASISDYKNAVGWSFFYNVYGLGDIDGSGTLDVDDVTGIIGMILEGSAPEYADVNGDGSIDIDDITVLINMLLNGH